MSIIKTLFPKSIAVRILDPDKSHWELDRARSIPIDGLEGEVGGLERLFILQKVKKVIIKFKPQLIKTMFGFKEELALYFDGQDYHPLDISFDNKVFGIKPVQWSHRFMVGVLKTHMMSRYKDQKFWEKFFPLIVFIICMILTMVYFKGVIGAIGEMGDSVGEKIGEAIIQSYQRIAESNLPTSAPKPTP